MSKPSGVFDIQRRVTYNLSYFASNYILIVAIVSLYLIVTNFPLLIVIVFDVASIYGIQKVFGNADELDLKYFTVHKNVLYTIIFIVNLPVLFISSPITTLMWLVLVSASIVLVHASLMDKPVEASYSDAV
ncbi:DEKNAAC102022 [Brettanomyces naardenensis]|uniref:PRA1 family protein n=1 Tax=Brettanomyces naardenensis TaxID=13370 RepID=A0A448YJG0_BRENA|nr:DEKNAAC102022 [Brettanomyces naardenensis]